MLIVYRAYLLVACILMLIIMTGDLLYTGGRAAARLKMGSQSDSGIFPKRSRNVNAWYLANVDDLSKEAYPQLFPTTSGQYKSSYPARIGLAQTTSCPIFRQQDNGSTDPLLIG